MYSEFMMHGQRNIKLEIGKFTLPMCTFDTEPNNVKICIGAGGGGICTGFIEELRVFPFTTITAMLRTHPHVNAVYQKDKRTRIGKT